MASLTIVVGASFAATGPLSSRAAHPVSVEPPVVVAVAWLPVNVVRPVTLSAPVLTIAPPLPELIAVPDAGTPLAWFVVKLPPTTFRVPWL